MARYSEDELREIYENNGGQCIYCGIRCAFSNYGEYGEKGAWEVAHSIADSEGGVSDLRNLGPAHIECNRRYQERRAREVRRELGGQEEGYLTCAYCGSQNVVANKGTTRFFLVGQGNCREWIYSCYNCGHVGKRWGVPKPEI